MAQERFDAVVVGAGPAGLTAAYLLARKGFEVAVLERGPEPGAKNMFGGRIYGHALDRVFSRWRERAPVERWVRRERLTLLCGEGALTLDYRVGKGVGEREDSFTAFLSKFLKWMASEAEEAGALVATGVRVDSIIFEDGGARGVEAGGERLEADYTLIAEGANTLLLEKHGIRRPPKPEEVAVGVKLVIKLDRKKIEERFGLEEWSGAAQFILGPPIGAAFLYTMKEYVSIGAVYRPNLMEGEVPEAKDVAEELRHHPEYSRLLDGGTPVEYSAHLIREGGMGDVLSRPYGPGYLVLGDAAGFILNTGFTVRGVDMAVESGRLAAEAVEKMRDGASPSIYQELLEESFITRSLRTFRRAPKFLSNQRLYTTYPEILCRFLENLYASGEESPRLYSAFREAMRSRVSALRMVRDLLEGLRSL